MRDSSRKITVMLPFGSVSLTTVFGATILSMLIGILWYSPFLYGKIWMDLVHLTPEECRDGMKPKYLLSGFATSFVSVYVIAIVMEVMVPLSLLAAYVMGGLLLVALPLPMEINGLLR